jgi:hypothetical protein
MSIIGIATIASAIARIPHLQKIHYAASHGSYLNAVAKRNYCRSHVEPARNLMPAWPVLAWVDGEPGRSGRINQWICSMRISEEPSGGTGRKYSAGFALALAVSALVLSADASSAQKLVDPDKVAPEYRGAAEKRRAEQLKILQCSKKADEAKVPKRDRAAHISECIDKGS